MITAKEAKFETLNRKEIEAIKADLEVEILRSIDSGAFVAGAAIPSDITVNVQDKLQQELEALGYSVEFPISPKKSGGRKVLVSWTNAMTEEV